MWGELKNWITLQSTTNTSLVPSKDLFIWRKGGLGTRGTLSPEPTGESQVFLQLLINHCWPFTRKTANLARRGGVGWPWGYRVTQLVRQGGPGGLITYLSNFKMTMLFWQSDSLALLAPTISPMNVGHFLGHSCFRIYTCITKRSHILGSCLRWRITPDTLPRYLQLWDRNLLKECVQNYLYYWSEEIFKSDVSQLMPWTIISSLIWH